MRDRLVVAFVSLTLAVVVVFLVERGYTTSALIRDQEERKVQRSAVVMAGLLGQTRDEVTPTLLEGLLFSEEHAVYVTPDGARVEADRHSADTAGNGHDAEDLTITRAVEGGGSLTLTRHAEIVDARVAAALLPLVLIALGLLVAAAAAAVLLAQRLARPLTALADAAGALGRGDFDVVVPRSRIPEVDQIGRALADSARDLDLLLQRERDFAAHASHELRTPITAARLELEDLAMSAHTPPEVVGRVTVVLGQLDRLSATVAGMLDASRASRVETRSDIDLAALVRDTAGRWSSLAPTRRFEVVVEPGVLPVRMPPGALMHVLDELVGNAVAHGDGTVTVSLSEAPELVEVRVADEGSRSGAAQDGRQPVTVGRSGLARATEIVEALDGRLRLTDDPATTFSLVLPRVARETVDA